jgi:hypothetical protein
MSLRRVKQLYCVAIMFFAIALACTGGLIEWIVAVLMLAGALPMFALVKRAASKSALIGFRQDLSLEAIPHNQPTDQVSEDQRAIHR